MSEPKSVYVDAKNYLNNNNNDKLMDAFNTRQNLGKKSDGDSFYRINNNSEINTILSDLSDNKGNGAYCNSDGRFGNTLIVSLGFSNEQVKAIPYVDVMKYDAVSFHIITNYKTKIQEEYFQQITSLQTAGKDDEANAILKDMTSNIDIQVEQDLLPGIKQAITEDIQLNQLNQLKLESDELDIPEENLFNNDAAQQEEARLVENTLFLQEINSCLEDIETKCQELEQRAGKTVAIEAYQSLNQLKSFRNDFINGYINKDEFGAKCSKQIERVEQGPLSNHRGTISKIFNKLLKALGFKTSTENKFQNFKKAFKENLNSTSVNHNIDDKNWNEVIKEQQAAIAVPPTVDDNGFASVQLQAADTGVESSGTAVNNGMQDSEPATVIKTGEPQQGGVDDDVVHLGSRPGSGP